MPISATPAGLSDEHLLEIIDDVTHCRAYYQLLIKALLLPGLMQLTETTIPTHLVICRNATGAAAPAVHQAFKHIPEISAVTQLDGVGHIPMFEAPQRIADLIVEWVDRHTPPMRQADSG